MGKPRTPTPLDYFLDVDFACLQKVLNKGRIDIQFQTDNQAANTKLRLWRLRNSLNYYKPGEALSEASKFFMFKRQGSRLTIIDRRISAEYELMKEAVKEDKLDNISDPQERDQRELVELTKEFENGNKD